MAQCWSAVNCGEFTFSSFNLLVTLLYNVVHHFGCIKLYQNKKQLSQGFPLGNSRDSDVSVVCSSDFSKCWLCRPVNLLQSKQNHFIYIIIFGALASDVLANIFNPSTEFLAEGYDSVWYSSKLVVFYLSGFYLAHCTALIFYVQVLLQTLYFAPLLACVNAPVKLLGYSLGLLYAMYL